MKRGVATRRHCEESPRGCQHQTVWCVCGSYFVFLRGSLAQTSAEVFPLSWTRQVPLRHVGNALVCFTSTDGRGGLWGWQLWASSLGTPSDGGEGGGYGVPLTRTNCLECEVRANTAGRISSLLWTLLVFLLVKVPIIFHCELLAFQKPSVASFKTRWLTLFKLELVLFRNKKSWLNWDITNILYTMERLHADLFLFSYQDFFIFTCPFKKNKTWQPCTQDT